MSDRCDVLCVDDNHAVAEALQCLIDSEDSLRWAGHLERADELLDTVAARQPAIVLLDLDMPGRPAFEVLTELTDAAPDTRVIIVSGFMSDALIDAAVDAGAWGYVNKNDGPGAIIAAIHCVREGGYALNLPAMGW
jgi:DNA-binding NarL/FixJ family response regulator